jgi:hypothetical protein
MVNTRNKVIAVISVAGLLTAGVYLLSNYLVESRRYAMLEAFIRLIALVGGLVLLWIILRRKGPDRSAENK